MSGIHLVSGGEEAEVDYVKQTADRHFILCR